MFQTYRLRKLLQTFNGRRSGVSGTALWIERILIGGVVVLIVCLGAMTF